MGEELVVSSGALEFAAHRVLGGLELGSVQGKAPQEGQVFGPVVLAVAHRVRVHGHIEHPMQAVLNAPVRPHDGQEALRREGGTRCRGEVDEARSKERLSVLPSKATTP